MKKTKAQNKEKNREAVNELLLGFFIDEGSEAIRQF